MRALRTTWAAAWLLGSVGSLTLAADDMTEKLLSFRPSLSGVEYETPTDPAARAACKGEKIAGGYVLRDGQGKILLRLVSRTKTGQLDQWGYYQDGFEIYRELDNNGDKSIDEVRWLNGGGSRIGKTKGGQRLKIISWNRISAEEAAKVLVQAIVNGDTELLDTVMATPADLEAAGLPKVALDAVSASEKQRVNQVSALRQAATATGWDAKTTFMGLSGMMPHLIPADAGVKEDLIICEGATIFVGSANSTNSARLAFLQVGDMVKVGDCWKFVDLPRVVDPTKNTPIPVADNGLRSWVYRGDATAPASGENPAIAAAMQELANYDNDKANVALLSGSAKDQARYHVSRIPALRKVVAAAETAGEAKIAQDHDRLIVDSLAAAYATGQYSSGADVLDQMSGMKKKVATYAAYKKIEADFAIQNEANPGNGAAVMDAWLGKLQGFVEKSPQCDEAPPAMMLLASSYEMNGKEAEARKWYTTLSKEHPTIEWGKKAAGAIRRLDIVGKPFALSGTDLRGQAVDVSQYHGKTLLVTFWATWANPARKDMPELAKLYAKYKSKGFEVVAVNLDNDKGDIQGFLEANPLPWPQIFEPGGMENRLATELGIISLPTMFLVDAEGKVINRTLRSASELEGILEKTLTGKVALGNK